MNSKTPVCLKCVFLICWENSHIFQSAAIITVSESPNFWMRSQTKPSTSASVDLDYLPRTWGRLSSILQDHPVIMLWTQKERDTIGTQRQRIFINGHRFSSIKVRLNSCSAWGKPMLPFCSFPPPPTSGPVAHLMRRLDSQAWKRQEGNKAGHWDNNPALL